MAGLLALAGIAQCLAGWWAVRRFTRAAAPPEPTTLPSVLLLKPLHGDEPLLEQALASACTQDYPHLRIVCDVRHRVFQAKPEKAHEQQPVAQLAFGLLVRQVVERLPHQRLEDENFVPRLAARYTAPLRGRTTQILRRQGRKQFRPEQLPRDHQRRCNRRVFLAIQTLCSH